MGVYEVRMKTHSSKDITGDFERLNNCVLHSCQPVILEVVAGRRKEVLYTMNCVTNECNRITSEKKEVEKIWNKWNPDATTPTK